MEAPNERPEPRPQPPAPPRRQPRAETRPYVPAERRPAPQQRPARWMHRELLPINENHLSQRPASFARGSARELVPSDPFVPEGTPADLVLELDGHDVLRDDWRAEPTASLDLGPAGARHEQRTTPVRPHATPRVAHDMSARPQPVDRHAFAERAPHPVDPHVAPDTFARQHTAPDTFARHPAAPQPVERRVARGTSTPAPQPVERRVARGTSAPAAHDTFAQRATPQHNAHDTFSQRAPQPVAHDTFAQHAAGPATRRASPPPLPRPAPSLPPPPPHELVARGSLPPNDFGASRPSLASDLAASSVATFSGAWPSLPEPPPSTRRRTRRLGETIGIRLSQLSLIAVVATVTVAGVRMWREAKQPPPVIPSAVIGGGDGRLELSADRQTLVRLDHGKPRWTARQARPLDEVSLAAPLVLGRAGDALSALELDSGHARFDWTVPAGERWGVQPPAALGNCLLVITTRGGNALAHCIDIASGAAKWTAVIAGGRECVAPPIAIAGAYLVQCPGFTTVIDDRDGTVSFDAGGLGLVQRDPPLLLRAGAHPLLAAWSPKTRKFARSGTPIRGTIETASSVVQHGPRLVVRAMSASDKLVTLASKTAASVAVTQPDLQLADNTPLVLDCGGDDSPRFQLLELAPKVGETFDPAAAQHRVLALLDVEAGRVAWTSRPIVPVRRAGQATAPICTRGHYFVPVDTGGGATALWIIDAETGTTTSALAFDSEAGATFADLAIDQIDRDRIVGVDRTGAFELDWRKPSARPGLHDARIELARVLGHLP